MTQPDPQREPQSETAEKDSITKTHEEYITDESRPSRTKQDYEREKRGKGATEKEGNRSVGDKSGA